MPPGDDPKHELILRVRRDANTSHSDPDWNGSELTVYELADQVAVTATAGTGTHRGYTRRVSKNGDTVFGSYEGSHRSDGTPQGTTWEGSWKETGGTGKSKNSKGAGTYRGKVTAEGAFTEFEGEVELPD